MSIIGSKWLEDTPHEHSGGKYADDTNFDYFFNESTGEYEKIENKLQFSRAYDKNNIYQFDGKQYRKK